MKTIKKIVSLPRAKYYIKHLEIINPLLPISLTPKEIEVLGMFLSLNGSVAQEDRFGTSCRKIVKEALSLSDGGLGNYIKSLKDKGFLYFSPQGKLQTFPFLIPEEKAQGYMFRLNLKEEK